MKARMSDLINIAIGFISWATASVGPYVAVAQYCRSQPSIKVMAAGSGVYHCILYGDGSTPVDVDCLSRRCGSWGRRALTAWF